MPSRHLHSASLIAFPARQSAELATNLSPALTSDLDAGFRPGSRDPFLSGKGSKTIAARFGHIRLGGREEWRACQLAEPVLSLAKGSNKARQCLKSVRPQDRTAGVDSKKSVEKNL
jgi:hypothetical protein